MPTDDSDTGRNRLLGLALTAVVVAAAVGGAVVLAAVGSPADAATQEEPSQVRVVHASPDSLNVNVSVDGEQVLSNVSYGTVSDYLEVPPGERTVTISYTRFLSNDSEVLFEGPVSLEPGTNYTIAAAGEATAPQEGAFAPVVLVDNATQPAEDEAAVRLVHLSPDAPPVDVTVAETGDVLYDNVSFRNTSGYATVPAGNYTLEVRPATANDSGDVVATFNVSLEGATAYSAMAVGYLNPASAIKDVPLDLLVTTDPTVAEEAPTGTATPTEAPTETATPTETEAPAATESPTETGAAGEAGTTTATENETASATETSTPTE